MKNIWDAEVQGLREHVALSTLGSEKSLKTPHRDSEKILQRNLVPPDSH